MSTVDGWTERAEALRDELVAAGKLTSPEWQAAVLAVPRHEFVPQFYQRGTDSGPASWELVSRSSPDTRERWWDGVWANTSLVTQLGPVGRWGRQVVTGPSSSSSAPSLMTRMLEALDIRDGNRVLEIGTGSGYNAALMSHRLGDQNVFSIDVDADLVDSARDRLTALGYQPTLAAADGITGLPQHAPYDRIIATCAVSRVPWSWAEQTTEGGLILVDVKPCASVGNLVLLRRETDRLEGRFDSGYATFMHMRTPAFHTEPLAQPTRNRDDAQRRTTTLWTERRPCWLIRAAHRGACRMAAHRYVMIFARSCFSSSGRGMVWSCRCSRGPGRMFLVSPRGWRVRRLLRGIWRCGSGMSWARSTPIPGSPPRSGSGAGRAFPRVS